MLIKISIDQEAVSFTVLLCAAPANQSCKIVLQRKSYLYAGRVYVHEDGFCWTVILQVHELGKEQLCDSRY